MRNPKLHLILVVLFVFLVPFVAHGYIVVMRYRSRLEIHY